MHVGLTIGIAIATAGRTAILTETLRDMRDQTHAPAFIVLCPAEEKDVDRATLDGLGLPIIYTRGGKGLTAQRNALLRVMPPVDVVMFLDDDFLMAADYLSEVADLFQANSSVMMTTGTVVADGANGPGLVSAEGRTILAAATKAPVDCVETVFNGYGCNMAVRWSTVADKDIWFDENLPLYSWAEDVDYSRQVARYGRVVKSSRLLGVHLGTKQGRTSGLRFGYSQVANQVYLFRKGVVSLKFALLFGMRNFLANLRGTIFPEPYIDRRGRLLGNYYGLVDLLRGRSSPGRILDL